MLYFNAYMWHLEKWYRLQSRIRDTDVDNEHVDTGGWGWDEKKNDSQAFGLRNQAVILPELGVCEKKQPLVTHGYLNFY